MDVAWDPQLSVGQAQIDAQHQELFRRIAGLLEAIQLGRGGDEVQRVLAFLGDYVHLHFGAEEALMVQHGYPQRTEHLEQHREFIRGLAQLKQELGRMGPTAELAALVGGRLVDWLREHIAATDLALGTWLAAQERAGPRRE
jgi:hemerythrin